MSKTVNVDFSLAMHNRTGKFFIGNDLIKAQCIPVSKVYYWHLATAPTGLLRRIVGRLQHWQILWNTVGWQGGSIVGGILPRRRLSGPTLHLDPWTVPTSDLSPDDIVLIHDLGPLTHTDLYAPLVGEIYGRIYERIATVGPHLVFVSETTRAEFASLYPQAAPRSSSIVYPAIRTDLARSGGVRPAGVDGPYLLTVGSIGHRKNQKACIEAFNASGLAGQGVRYVLCGGPEPGYDEVAELATASQGVVLLPYVSDAELAWLYANALGFVLASRLEGFGMPVAEAIRLDLVPLLLAGGVLEEVAGEGAIYATDNVASIRDGMIALATLSDEDRRARLGLLTASIARFDHANVMRLWAEAYARWT